MELAYVVQILLALLIISLFLIVLMTSMICASLYSTRPLWLRLHEDNEMEVVSQPSSQQDWEIKFLSGLWPQSSRCQTSETKLPFNGLRVKMNPGLQSERTLSQMVLDWLSTLLMYFKIRSTNVWTKLSLLWWKLIRNNYSWLMVHKN